MATHTKFKATIYVLTNAEGGRENPIFDGYNGAKFSFADNSVTGRISLTGDHSMAEPGDTLEVIVGLLDAVPIEIGTSFEVFEPGAREWQGDRWVQTFGDKLVIRGEALEVLN